MRAREVGGSNKAGQVSKPVRVQRARTGVPVLANNINITFI
jgi:hypothetical protein